MHSLTKEEVRNLIREALAAHVEKIETMGESTLRCRRGVHQYEIRVVDKTGLPNWWR